MIWLSLKTYKEATGNNAIKLLRIAKKVMEETGVRIIPCVQPTDLYRVIQELDIEVWAQHVDPIDPERNFGWISPYSIKEAGATGTVINHAEHPLNEEQIEKTLNKSKEYGLKTLVICETVELAQLVASWNSDYIAFEEPSLIAGTVSMIDQEEEKIKYLAQTISHPLIIGAGISTGEHVKKTLAVGGKGVILASAVVLAEDPEAKLRELAEGF